MRKFVMIFSTILIFLILNMQFFSTKESFNDILITEKNISENIKINLEEKNGIVTNIWLDDTKKLDKLKDNNIKYLFVDIGDLNDSIKINEKQIKYFLKFVRAYEESNSYDFIILPYSEINSKNISIDKIFIENYISASENLHKFGFDGFHIDIESLPLKSRDNYIALLDELNKNFPDSIISIYAGHLGNSSNDWEWDIYFYKKVSKYTDLIIFPGYDLGIENEEMYKKNIKEKVMIISDNNWNCKFMIALPTHKDYPENLNNAYSAYKEEVSKHPQNDFIGPVIFSEWTIKEKDWVDFNQLNSLKKLIILNK